MAQNKTITISRLLWFRLTHDLHRRGGREAESGAFLLAPAGSQRVQRYALLDDLDPGCLRGGYIKFSGRGYVVLSQLCQRFDLKVIADVHTHPSAWVGQSGADLEHPMMSRPGHVALIVPNLARLNRFTLLGVGIFLYHGDGVWEEPANLVRLAWL